MLSCGFEQLELQSLPYSSGSSCSGHSGGVKNDNADLSTNGVVGSKGEEGAQSQQALVARTTTPKP